MHDQPFHTGEIRAQALAGETLAAERNAGALRDSLPRGALDFLRHQRQVVLAAEGDAGQMWCSILYGPAGFLQPAADGRGLVIDTADSSRSADDPLWQAEGDARPWAALALEPETRRRLKINGTATVRDRSLALQVTDSFALCPKYIQRSALAVPAAAGAVLPGATTGAEPGRLQLETVAAADTFFVASIHAERGPDASHRGGLPRFVQPVAAGTLRIPDYPGNSMFNTFGNLLLDHRAGLVFADLRRHVLLQMTGTATVLWNAAPAPGHAPHGTARFWDFTCERWVETPLAPGIDSALLEYSPFNPPL